jgi:YVTN family beta-propeller protein
MKSLSYTLPMKISTLALALFFLAANSQAQLLVANQKEHTAQLIDLATRQPVFTAGIDINGHEIAASPDGRFAYVPIYSNVGVGHPGTDGSTIHVIDLSTGRDVRIIDLGKPVRPHCIKFGPDGLLYVSAELDRAIYVLDPAKEKVIAKIPTGADQSHMFVISPDGTRAYTANVKPGSVSVLDLKNRSLIKVIPVAEEIQRISISPDGRHVYTHDQTKPRIAVIDTTTNEIEKWIDVPATVYSSAISADGKLLIGTSGKGQLFVVDLTIGKVSRVFAIAPGSGEVLLVATGVFEAGPNVGYAGTVYVSCAKAGVVEVLDTNKMELQEPIRLTPGADGLAWRSTPPRKI